jgi:hypothetical protein
MIEAAIYSILSTNAPLLALVGTDSDGDPKICPVIEKQGVTAPYIVFDIKTKPIYFKNGVETNESIVTIFVYQKGYLATANIAVAARNAVELVSGTFASTTIDEMIVESIDDDYFMSESESLNVKILTIKASHN